MRPLIRKILALTGPTFPILAVSAGFAVLLTALALPHVYGFLAKPRGAHRTAGEAAQAFLRLGNAYRRPCALESPPVYCDRDLPLGSAPNRHFRHVWIGTVAANGQQLDLVMNDNSGKLMCAFSPDSPTGHAVIPTILTVVSTPVQAVRLSMQSARKLEMVPSGAEAALVRIPKRIKHNNRWLVEWRVRKIPGAKPYSLKVMLSGANGRILSAANEEELADFMDH